MPEASAPGVILMRLRSSFLLSMSVKAKWQIATQDVSHLVVAPDEHLLCDLRI